MSGRTSSRNNRQKVFCKKFVPKKNKIHGKRSLLEAYFKFGLQQAIVYKLEVLLNVLKVRNKDNRMDQLGSFLVSVVSTL